ncbi:hypothetical protein N9190_00980 [bacterium]|jgi:hypothetical protein|nr:hypothetical protein [Akkermansiaceae bacterium]MDB4410658.1 hypothetical protein [bacterium]MDA8974716.1 hypothetical protein [Akkermansiaceae bacterium]MDB4487598.1 hypothetical protein [Akkermansiaceae bacterium]MDB4548416.1 hypothetical protein [Akkermansiaceae bacterium]
MLKVKDFVFALLTLICVSPAVGEDQVFPKAKEWPKYAGFEWGMSEDEFFEACAAKNLRQWKRLNPRTGTYITPPSVKGKILGEDVEVKPFFEDGKGEILKGYWIIFTVSLKDREDFFKRLFSILKEKYGPAAQYKKYSKQYGWGAPDMPHVPCLVISWSYDLEYYTENLKTPNHAVVQVSYRSQSSVKSTDEAWKRQAAEKRELEKKAKEDEKDF